MSFYDLAYLFYLWLQKKMENLLGSFQYKKKKKHGFLFVGSIYIKREPIIVLIEQDSGHDMGFGFENLISKIVREKSFFNMLLLILLLIL